MNILDVAHVIDKRLVLYAVFYTRTNLDQILTPYVWTVTAKDAESENKWRVDAIALGFSPFVGQSMLHLQGMLRYDWEEVAKIVASLPASSYIVIGLTSREDLVLFINEIAPKMSVLRESRRPKYALLDYDASQPEETRWGWVRCDPSSPREGMSRTTLIGLVDSTEQHADLVRVKRVSLHQLPWLYQ